tara:strand:+ start:33968 stop:34138 length:171 start_codon:yes stop_codon:yes gene_type:complete
MRKQLKEVLIDKPTCIKIENVFKEFGFSVQKKTVNFILNQKSSIEEKIYNLIEGCL